MDSSWNVGSIGIAGPPLRGPSSTRLLAEPPLSPPVSAGPSPMASAQPLQPAAPLAPPTTPALETSPAAPAPEQAQRAAAPLESLLIRFRLITSEQLDEALREKLETGKDVGAIVVERGWVNEDQLARLLSYAPAFAAPAEPVLEAPEPQAEAVEPETIEPEAVEPEAVEPETIEPEAVEPEAVEREAEVEPEVAPETVPEPQAELVEVEERPEPGAEPEIIDTAGPIVSAEQSIPPALEIATSPMHELPPALELVEPERPAEPEIPIETGRAAAELVVPVVQPPAPEPAPEPAATEPLVELAPLAPVQPAAEPVAEAEAAAAPEAAIQPEATPERVNFEPAPESAAAEPEPTAPALAPQPQTVHFVEPGAIETIARVFVRLSNGERVEAGSFDDIGAAKARAEEVVRDVSEGQSGWPFFGGRYIRPEAIVSVDVDATVVRYA